MNSSLNSKIDVLQIFLSFSGEASKQFSLELRRLLQKLYESQVSRQQIQFFCSEEDMSRDGGTNTAQDRINKRLRESNILISILTEKNVNSPWLMFEAGAVMTQKSGKVIPFNFGRNLQSLEQNLEPIFAHLQRYEYQPSLQDEINRYNFRKFLIELNSFICELEKDMGGLRYSIDETHMDLFIDKNWDNYSKAIGEVFAKYLSETKHQAIFDFNWIEEYPVVANRKIEYTPITLFDYFRKLKEKLKEEHSLGGYTKDYFFYENNNTLYFKEYKKEQPKIPKVEEITLDYEKIPKVEEITLGDEKGLRVSTFYAFVALGEHKAKILLYRRKSRKSVVVKNDGWDVFGSVPFDAEGALEAKLGSSPLLKAPIQRIIPINGIALEENSLGGINRQSVVMVGVLVVIDEETLEQSSSWRNEQCFLLDVSNDDNWQRIEADYEKYVGDMQTLSPPGNLDEDTQKPESKEPWQKLYTSKAWLSIQALKKEFKKLQESNSRDMPENQSNEGSKE